MAIKKKKDLYFKVLKWTRAQPPKVKVIFRGGKKPSIFVRVKPIDIKTVHTRPRGFQRSTKKKKRGGGLP